jgi:hypothetical protein
MKKCLLLVLTVIIILFSSFTSLAQAIEDPGAYMTAINNAQTEMRQKYMAYISAVAHGRRARKIEKMRLAALESISNSKYKTVDISIYKGDNSLRKNSIDYIELCYRVFNEDYKHIVDMEEIAEQSFDEMQSYMLLMEKTNEKLKVASDNMQTASKEFAKKYNVKLIESKDELSEKLSTAGELNSYRDKIYLLFFKCNYEDGVMTTAMNNKKVKDIEQARNSLIQYANEGLAALNGLKTFQGDPTLANACREILGFYKKMAETDAPKIVDFFLKSEDFEKIKKAMDAKSNKSKEDIDAYNKAVKDINTAINVSNQTNNNINNNRNQAIQNWENADKIFSDQHMPHYK